MRKSFYLAVLALTVVSCALPVVAGDQSSSSSSTSDENKVVKSAKAVGRGVMWGPKKLGEGLAKGAKAVGSGAKKLVGKG